MISEIMDVWIFDRHIFNILIMLACDSNTTETNNS